MKDLEQPNNSKKSKQVEASSSQQFEAISSNFNNQNDNDLSQKIVDFEEAFYGFFKVAENYGFLRIKEISFFDNYARSSAEITRVKDFEDRKFFREILKLNNKNENDLFLDKNAINSDASSSSNRICKAIIDRNSFAIEVPISKIENIEGFRKILAKVERSMVSCYYNSYSINREDSGLIINKRFLGGYLNDKNGYLSRTNAVVEILNFFKNDRKDPNKESSSSENNALENPDVTLLIITGKKAINKIKNSFDISENIKVFFIDEKKYGEISRENLSKYHLECDIKIKMKGGWIYDGNSRKDVEVSLYHQMTRDESKKVFSDFLDDLVVKNLNRPKNSPSKAYVSGLMANREGQIIN